MTTSYSQIIKQIETLQRQAESARSKEVAGVVSRIKEAIAFYRLSAADLGLSGASGRVASVAKTGKSTRAPKFADGSGNTWGGRGPRPAWLSQALASGKSLSDFALGASGTAASKPAGRKKAASKGRKVAPKYRDENGNTWAGRGLQPRWFKEALAQGKTPESMLI